MSDPEAPRDPGFLDFSVWPTPRQQRPLGSLLEMQDLSPDSRPTEAACLTRSLVAV